MRLNLNIKVHDLHGKFVEEITKNANGELPVIGDTLSFFIYGSRRPRLFKITRRYFHCGYLETDNDSSQSEINTSTVTLHVTEIDE